MPVITLYCKKNYWQTPAEIIICASKTMVPIDNQEILVKKQMGELAITDARRLTQSEMIPKEGG